MNTETIMSIIGSLRDASRGAGRTVWALHKASGASLYIAEKIVTNMKENGLVAEGRALTDTGRTKRVWRLNPEIRDMIPARDNDDEIHALAIWLEISIAQDNLTLWLQNWLEIGMDQAEAGPAAREAFKLDFEDWLEASEYVFSVLPDLLTDYQVDWASWVADALG